MRLNKPSNAIGLCVVIGCIAIPTATCMASDKGSAFMAGIGALGQVIVAVLLYFLTKDQLDHARSEATYRKIEQRIAKRERLVQEMGRVQAAFGNAKTGIGKTRCDQGQVDRLDRIRDDMRLVFQQPASTHFNKMVEAAKAAASIGTGKPGYAEKISAFESSEKIVYDEMKNKISNLQTEIKSDERILEKS